MLRQTNLIDIDLAATYASIVWHLHDERSRLYNTRVICFGFGCHFTKIARRIGVSESVRYGARQPSDD